ncbi:MAG: hypothetical protein R6U98_10185 [Pirellulaceae bacterium]
MNGYLWSGWAIGNLMTFPGRPREAPRSEDVAKSFALAFQEAGEKSIFQAVEFFRMGRCPTQAVLPLVGLAAEKVIRDPYNTPISFSRLVAGTGM